MSWFFIFSPDGPEVSGGILFYRRAMMLLKIFLYGKKDTADSGNQLLQIILHAKDNVSRLYAVLRVTGRELRETVVVD